MKKDPISKPLVIALSIVIIFSCAFSVREYLRLKRLDIIAVYKETITQKIASNHGALTNKNVNLISSWMTFDYINTIFKLPENYLKTSLSISDPRYPRISIERYEKNHALNPLQFLTEVQSAVANYFSDH